MCKSNVKQGNLSNIAWKTKNFHSLFVMICTSFISGGFIFNVQPYYDVLSGNL